MMTSMKRLALLTLAVLLSVSAFAQNEAKVKVDLHAGYTLATYFANQKQTADVTFKLPDQYYGLKSGYAAGVGVEIPLKERLSLRTGFSYARLVVGAAEQSVRQTGDSTCSVDYSEKTTAHNFCIPVLVKYAIPVRENRCFEVAAGPYLSVTAGGKLTGKGSYAYSTGVNYSEKIEFDPWKNEKISVYRQMLSDDFVQEEVLYNGRIARRVDFGLSLELDYKVSRFYIGAAANFGLLNNMAPGITDITGLSRRNFNLQIMLGYQIN